ncbi:MAG: hypothetical protein O8C64_03130 [Candidatus Methanoperedens sp.]|nr:hypothetical protein [Candidatus Methanoperedens sp.]MCZ7406231.1 hypothetical protein [Candidatus Methanoperedens sp.]
MDEGLGFALVPIFVIVLPIVISSFILYFILRNKKMSIVGSIIGFIGAFVIGFVIPVRDGQGIIWHLMRIDIIAQSTLAPIVMVIFFGLLTAFTGLIVIKIFRR